MVWPHTADCQRLRHYGWDKPYGCRLCKTYLFLRALIACIFIACRAQLKTSNRGEKTKEVEAER